jgi:hypothetical protein
LHPAEVTGYSKEKVMKNYLYLIGCLLIPACLFAGDIEKNLELTIFTGDSLGKYSIDETFSFPPNKGGVVLPIVYMVKGSVDNSVLFGGSIGYYFNKHSEIEGIFGIAPSHRLREIQNLGPSPLDQNIVTYNYDANYVYNINWKSVRPFFTAGIGMISRDGHGDTDHDLSYNFGTGAKIYFKNIGLRFEVNDHIVPDYFQTGTNKHVVRIQSGLMFNF